MQSPLAARSASWPLACFSKASCPFALLFFPWLNAEACSLEFPVQTVERTCLKLRAAHTLTRFRRARQCAAFAYKSTSPRRYLTSIFELARDCCRACGASALVPSQVQPCPAMVSLNGHGTIDWRLRTINSTCQHGAYRLAPSPSSRRLRNLKLTDARGQGPRGSSRCKHVLAAAVTQPSAPAPLASSPAAQSLTSGSSAADRLELWLKQQDVQLPGLTVTADPGGLNTDVFAERDFAAGEVGTPHLAVPSSD